MSDRWRCVGCRRLYVSGERPRKCGCGSAVFAFVRQGLEREVVYDATGSEPDDVLHKAPRAWLWGRASA